MTITKSVDEIIWRKDLYPRFEPDRATIQRYAENLDVLPPIEINQHNELIDGFHRWTAHKTAKCAGIKVTVTQTESDNDLLLRAIHANASHGLQLTDDDKKSLALRLYDVFNGDKKALAKLLSVSEKQISRYVAKKDEERRERIKRMTFEMWISCHTQDEISEITGQSQSEVAAKIQELSEIDRMSKSDNFNAFYQDPEWHPPLYDIWNFSKNNNSTKHFGNTPVEIVDNLLYTFTQPFDIVIDPFAGGGSTIDICKKRMRRFWVSDRTPTPARPDIRMHDVVFSGISGPSRWGDVALVYLDPPYWKQAAGKYSNDPTDLANMTKSEFDACLAEIIAEYGAKMKPGAHLACIISPTQWPNEDHHTDYHDLDLVRNVNKKWKLIRRVLCPYSTEQYNGTQVEIAKRDKLWLVLTRTLLIWERQ